ncbi:MAG: YdeI/OmpD-associated family protein [Cryobacterium sp.]|nr:YdeI/OmpD-associated family protein [Cryobacterium sp.]
MPAEFPDLLLPDAAAWRTWLERNHAKSPGVRLVLSRSGGAITSLFYDGALDEALCFGWIDGQARRRDEQTTYQRFQPRGPRSIWSLRNVGHIERLEREGRMHAAGRAAVAAAKADGRWDRAYAGPATAEAPPDLLAAIAAVPQAQAMYDVLTSQNRYALYFRLSQLTTPEARARSIAAVVDKLARHETPHAQKRSPESPPRG